MPGGVGLVAVAVERLGKHFDIRLVVGVACGLLDEEGTVGLAFFGLHDGVFGYAAISEISCRLNFEGILKIPQISLLFEENLFTGGSDHGTTVFSRIHIVAHYAVLVSIKVANGRFTIGCNISIIRVTINTRKDYI